MTLRLNLRPLSCTLAERALWSMRVLDTGNRVAITHTEIRRFACFTAVMSNEVVSYPRVDSREGRHRRFGTFLNPHQMESVPRGNGAEPLTGRRGEEAIRKCVPKLSCHRYPSLLSIVGVQHRA